MGMKNVRHNGRIHSAWLALAIYISIFSIIPMNISVAEEPAQVNVTVDPNKTIGVNKYSLGFQLDGYDINQWRVNATLRDLAKNASFKLVRFFEHRLGKPCIYWDESTKSGVWDWTKIDDLVRKIFEIGAEPLIVLGFAKFDGSGLSTLPNGMQVNQTTLLPNPDQWAAYCAEWVRHFKSVGLPVRYYEIVNEAFNYFGWNPDPVKLKYFMDLFNAAARAMRAVNPEVMIGNDESNKKVVLDYFIRYGEPLDFISFHRYGANSLSVSESDLFKAAETKYLVETTNKYAPEQAVKIYKETRGVDLPVIVSEGNLNSAYSSGADPRTRTMVGAVYTALSIRAFILKNITYSVYFTFGSYGTEGIGMVNLENNQPWYPYYAQKMIGNNLAVGDKLVYSSSSSEDVRTLAWLNGERLNILLMSKVDELRAVYITGVKGQINYMKIDNSISWEKPEVQMGTIDSTKPLILNGYAVALLQMQMKKQPVIFKDNFETGDFSNWTGTRTTAYETVKVVNFMPQEGTFHCRFALNGDEKYENAYCYKKIDKVDELYVRAYVNIPKGLPLTDNGDRFFILRLTAGGNLIVGFGLRRSSGVDKWVLYLRNGNNLSGPIYGTAGTSVVTGKWYCIEIYWKGDSSNGLVEVYIDGIKIIEVNNINTLYFGGVDEIDFGVISAAGVQKSLIVYGDNIVISTTRM
ncbi:MAG: hypothetical protein QXX94_07090 [Candidatus Bathyarchaeia archaeon]